MGLKFLINITKYHFMEMTCLLIAGIVGIICGFLGYLIGKTNKNSSQNDTHNYKSDLEACTQRNSQLQSDIDSLRSQLKDSSSDLKTNLVSAVAPSINKSLVEFDAIAAKAVFGKKVKEDDLKIIEGIGPKIEELFKTSGILTWKALGDTSVERCNKILSKAGDRFSIHNPGTWPRQSKLAAEGKWQELKDWQDQLDKGKEK
jgi:predicted flap endonuclease-1-like 5' DNA nuclease